MTSDQPLPVSAADEDFQIALGAISVTAPHMTDTQIHDLIDELGNVLKSRRASRPGLSRQIGVEQSPAR